MVFFPDRERGGSPNNSSSSSCKVHYTAGNSNNRRNNHMNMNMRHNNNYHEGVNLVMVRSDQQDSHRMTNNSGVRMELVRRRASRDSIGSYEGILRKKESRLTRFDSIITYQMKSVVRLMYTVQ